MPLASGMRGPTVVTAKGASIPGARLISQPGSSHGATDSDVTVMVQVSGVCNVNSEPRMLLGPISGSLRWVVCQPEGHGSSRPDRYKCKSGQLTCANCLQPSQLQLADSQAPESPRLESACHSSPARGESRRRALAGTAARCVRDLIRRAQVCRASGTCRLFCRNQLRAAHHRSLAQRPPL